ncbi:hypothetical protein JTB14_012866 [Gonioctena quinquepunctata]|nr:hypothetical protein JTB14_012866 [Gonioctena quinquepunctata]
MVLVRPEDNIFRNCSSEGQPTLSVDVKIPKRVLHFCDGVLEEYSTDEEDDLKKEKLVLDPDPNDLTSLTSGHFLVSIQQRTKWKETGTQSLTIEDLVLREDNTPPHYWRMGHVIEKTAKGILKSTPMTLKVTYDNLSLKPQGFQTRRLC